MDVSKQHWINMELTHDIANSSRIIVPFSVPAQFDDVVQLQTRDWVVPGEILVIFIEINRCLSSIDEFSFYCSVTDTESSAKLKSNPNFVPLTSISTRPPIRSQLNIKKMKDGRVYYPVKIQVPIFQTKKYLISAFCLRNPDPIATCECFSLQPFSVIWSRHLTPQSVIVQFQVNCKLPEIDRWKRTSISIESANLKFSESAEDEPAFTSSVAIIKTSETSFSVSDGDSISLAFILKPLSDDGAVRIAKMPLTFTLAWIAPSIVPIEGNQMQYIANFSFNAGYQQADLVISAPMTKCELLKPSSIPLRITSMPSTTEPRTVDICFDSGKIQPMTKSQQIHFKGGYEAKTIEFGFIPLCIGEHKLKIWAKSGDDIIYPMLPICLSVEKPL